MNLLLLSTSSLLALAQPAADPAQPPATPVADNPLDPVVVTASRTGEAVPASYTGSSVTVIDAKTLEGRQTRLVSDVLRDVPGVAVSRAGPAGG